MFDWDFLRRDWEDPKLPVTGPNILFDRVDKMVVHYTAAPKIPVDVPRYLRDMQAAYVRDRGYSLGYNCAVDQTGKTYEVRGFDLRCAANRNVNESSFAVLVLVDGDDEASPQAAAAVRRIVGHGQQFFKRVLKVVGHGEVGATACPGVGLRRQLAAGVFDPNMLGGSDMFVLDYLPNTSKWVRLAWDGIQRVAHVRSGHVAAIHQAAGVEPITVSKTQLEALLREPASVKLGDNPFASGPAADAQLSAAWRV
jgi:hypothetical protein